MAGSLNKVTLIGNLGKDPESRTMQNGGKVVSFSIATSESWKDKDGERQQRTQWHNVVIFNEQLGAVAAKYLKKGSKIYVEGQLETRKWQDKDGNDKWTTEIVLRPYRGELTMLDARRDEDGADTDQDDAAAAGKQSPPARSADELEDEIPF